MHVKQSHQRLPLNGRERTFGQRIGNCFVVRTHEMEIEVSKDKRRKLSTPKTTSSRRRQEEAHAKLENDARITRRQSYSGQLGVWTERAHDVPFHTRRTTDIVRATVPVSGHHDPQRQSKMLTKKHVVSDMSSYCPVFKMRRNHFRRSKLIL